MNYGDHRDIDILEDTIHIKGKCEWSEAITKKAVLQAEKDNVIYGINNSFINIKDNGVFNKDGKSVEEYKGVKIEHVQSLPKKFMSVANKVELRIIELFEGLVDATVLGIKVKTASNIPPFLNTVTPVNPVEKINTKG